jgi:hypothetical protein
MKSPTSEVQTNMVYITKYCKYEVRKGIECALPLSERAYNYSMERYGKPLCFNHQKRYVENTNKTNN